jgi:hypothetical protein
MNDVRMPIETIREGNKITKTCVEDVYKIANRVIEAMDKAYNNSVDIIDSLQSDEYGEDSAVVFGKGTSQPCLTDAFDEEIGNNIAFMKMKLNANIKTHNFLCKIFNQYMKMLDTLNEDIDRVDKKIMFDLDGIRKHNSSYLSDIENKLGICSL